MKSKVIERLMFGVIGVTTLGIVTVAGVQVVSLAGANDASSAQPETRKATVEKPVPDVTSVSATTEAPRNVQPPADDDADDATQTPQQQAPVQNQTPAQPSVNYDDDDDRYEDDDDLRDDNDDSYDDERDDLDDVEDDYDDFDDDDGDDLYDD